MAKFIYDRCERECRFFQVFHRCVLEKGHKGFHQLNLGVKYFDDKGKMKEEKE